jgi:hypothetical protein
MPASDINIGIRAVLDVRICVRVYTLIVVELYHRMWVGSVMKTLVWTAIVCIYASAVRVLSDPEMLNRYWGSYELAKSVRGPLEVCAEGT